MGGGVLTEMDPLQIWTGVIGNYVPPEHYSLGNIVRGEQD